MDGKPILSNIYIGARANYSKEKYIGNKGIGIDANVGFRVFWPFLK